MKEGVKMKSKTLAYNKFLVFFCIFVISLLTTGCGREAPIILNFSVSSPTINAGDSTTLVWSVSNADTVTITPEVGTVASSDSTPVSPTVTTTYILTATNSTGSVTDTVTVSVSIELPDLVISSFTYSPASPNTANPITFTAVVENIGTGSANVSVLSFKIGGESNPPTFNVPALASGATYEVQRQEVFDIAQGYIYTVIADVNNDVTESDETNNQKKGTFIVSG